MSDNATHDHSGDIDAIFAAGEAAELERAALYLDLAIDAGVQIVGVDEVDDLNVD